MLVELEARILMASPFSIKRAKCDKIKCISKIKNSKENKHN
jgi:hypothetical protein